MVTQGGVTVTEYANATSTADQTSAKAEDTGLAKGAIIGIAVGVAAAVIAGIALLVFLLRRKRSNDDEAIRWPELNRHGDSDVHHALPAHNVAGGSRMSLGDDLDGPEYITVMEGGDTALHGSNFGSSPMLNDYDEKTGQLYDPAAQQQQQSQQHGGQYAYSDHEDYNSYPPVQPQPSPIHGAPYDWESHDGHYQPDNGYSGMTRQESPPMAGVGAGPGGIAPGMTFPQATRY